MPLRGGLKRTRPSSGSKTATMYKLKGYSSNMQTGQGFKHRELVCPAGLSGRHIKLIHLTNFSCWLCAYCTMHIIACKVHLMPCAQVVKSTCCKMQKIHFPSCTLHHIYSILHIASDKLHKSLKP